ncbi:hypothetical protein AVEN_50917-1 [Araneus ventricosus]|uniref:Uncharacterized protein n=1 Tax=Araneus ventricosus TaxID=182803 RepID=A0A4Y2DYQ5_ARAVE|nr:hypothetical protein AVEN_50917-1 [Araneus ventricosus]
MGASLSLTNRSPYKIARGVSLRLTNRSPHRVARGVSLRLTNRSPYKIARSVSLRLMVQSLGAKKGWFKANSGGVYKSTALVILNGYPENETIGGTKCAEWARRTRKQMSSEAMFDEAILPTVAQKKFLTNPKNKDRLISIVMNKFSLNMAIRDAWEIVAVEMSVCFVQCCVFIVGTTAITGRFK